MKFGEKSPSLEAPVPAGYYNRCHGEFTPTRHEVYEIVLVAINKEQDLIRPGRICSNPSEFMVEA